MCTIFHPLPIGAWHITKTLKEIHNDIIEKQQDIKLSTKQVVLVDDFCLLGFHLSKGTITRYIYFMTGAFLLFYTLFDWEIPKEIKLQTALTLVVDPDRSKRVTRNLRMHLFRRKI